MEYTELRIKVNRKDLEDLQTLLIGNGLGSMMIEDPEDVKDILEHPEVYRYDYIDEGIEERAPAKPIVTLYFSDDEEGRAQLKTACGLMEDCAARMDISLDTREIGDDSEWLYKWQEYFKPARVGERIIVKPSWEDYRAEERDLVIEMDPGMAFGSGLHETTSMCIKALEEILGEEQAADPGDGVKVLDVGCGTGILAIAAALLGADECLGIDIDPDAVRVAEENVSRNHLEDRIKVRLGDLTEGVDYSADIIAANLMADLVIRLSPAAAKHLDRGGWYITSGILDIKEDLVKEEIRKAGFTIEKVLRDGEWRAVIARK